jgi:hypothetical protein
VRVKKRVGRINQIKPWVELIRDVGLILGIPVLIGVGMQLYTQQIEILKARTELLKETQYDRALSIIKSQRELHELERQSLEKSIQKTEGTLSKNTEALAEREKEIAILRARLTKVTETIGSLDTSAHVIKLASQELNVTQNALKAFLRSLEEKHVPDEQIESELRNIAHIYNELRIIFQYDSNDPEVKELLNAVEQVDYEKASQLLPRAYTSSTLKLAALLLRGAHLYEARGSLEQAGLLYKTAIATLEETSGGRSPELLQALNPTATLLEHALLTQGFVGTSKATVPRH